MASWYRVRTHYGIRIERVEITRTTAACVFYMQHGKEQRERKRSGGVQWHSTWGGAKAHAMQYAAAQQELAQEEMERWRDAVMKLSLLAEAKETAA